MQLWGPVGVVCEEEEVGESRVVWVRKRYARTENDEMLRTTRHSSSRAPTTNQARLGGLTNAILECHYFKCSRFRASSVRPVIGLPRSSPSNVGRSLATSNRRPPYLQSWSQSEQTDSARNWKLSGDASM